MIDLKELANQLNAQETVGAMFHMASSQTSNEDGMWLDQKSAEALLKYLQQVEEYKATVLERNYARCDWDCSICHEGEEDE